MIQRAKSWLTGCRGPDLEPATSTAEARSARRYRQAAWTSITSVAVRGIGLLTSLISIRLLLGYLGAERFGVWATLTSLIAFLSFADLGLGNGLLNLLAKDDAQGDRRQARENVSTAFALLVAVAAALGVLLITTYSSFNWSSIFNVEMHESRIELPATILAFGIVFLISIPLAVGQKIELAHQTGARYNVSLAVASVVAFGGLLLGIRAGAGLPFLVVATVAAPALAGGISSVRNFFWTRPWLRPQLGAVRRGTARLLAGSGALFLALQVSASLSYSIDNVVITRVLGPAEVAEYAVPFKLFNVTHFLIAVMMAPLWPAYREALVRRDHLWIRRTLKRSLYVSLSLSTALALALTAWGPQILRMWLGRDLDPSPSLLIGLALWTILAAAGNAIAMFLNGTGILRVQVILSSLMTVANLGLSIELCRRIGVEGAIWGTVVAYCAFIVIPLTFYLPRVLNRLTKSDEQPL